MRGAEERRRVVRGMRRLVAIFGGTIAGIGGNWRWTGVLDAIDMGGDIGFKEFGSFLPFRLVHGVKLVRNMCGLGRISYRQLVL